VVVKINWFKGNCEGWTWWCMPVIPATREPVGGSWSEACPARVQYLIWKRSKNSKRTKCMAEVKEHLLSKYKALNSITSTTKYNNKGGRGVWASFLMKPQIMSAWGIILNQLFVPNIYLTITKFYESFKFHSIMQTQYYLDDIVAFYQVWTMIHG
jgi:hypothetical protein